MMTFSATRSALISLAAGTLACVGSSIPVLAQQAPIRAVGNVVTPGLVPAADNLTYADLADLADAAELVARAQVRKASRLKPEQAPGLAPGMARMLVEARIAAVLSGPAMGETVRYLADVPLDANGKPPKLNKMQVLVFARTVAGRAGELRLVDGGAQLPWSSAVEARTRTILTEMLAPDAPPRIKALREVLFVPGNLAGEGETQLFLQTETGAPVSLSVVRRPGMARTWGVSLSEIVDQAARPPARNTLTWYRLACSLPATIPPSAGLSGSEADHRAADEDYAHVLGELGECTRTRPAVAR